MCGNYAPPDAITGHSSGSVYGLACLTGGLSDLREPAGGHWRRRLYRKAFQAGQLVAAGELSEQLASDSLVEAGMRLRLASDSRTVAVSVAVRDVERLVAGGMRKGASKPRHAPPLRASGRLEVAEQVAAWESVALSRAWTGRAGAGQLALLRALYRRAGVVGRLTLRESVRELQCLAGHSSPAVTQRALRVLLTAGWLVRDSRASRQSGRSRSQWRLVAPPVLAPAVTALPVSAGLSEPAETSEQVAGAVGWLDPAHDCWHQRQTAWRVAAWLAEQPDSSVADIAAGTGLHRSTVRRQLDWLLAERLVAAVDVGGRERQVYSVVSGVELTAAHSAERWPESPARVRERRHEQDRVVHARWLEAVIQRQADALVASLPAGVPAG